MRDKPCLIFIPFPESLPLVVFQAPVRAVPLTVNNKSLYSRKPYKILFPTILMVMLKSRWVLGIDLHTDDKIGSIFYGTIELSKPEIEFLALYRIRGKNESQYDAQILAAAFDTRKDYRKFIESGTENPEGYNPAIHIADEERICFSSNRRIGKAKVSVFPLSLPIGIKDGEKIKIKSDCLFMNSPEPNKIIIEPLDPVFKKYALLMSHLYPHIKTREKGRGAETYF